MTCNFSGLTPVCLICMDNYFLNSHKNCVEAKVCGASTNYFADIENKICAPCNEACNGCKAAGKSNCIECDARYSMNALGSCEEIICGDDEYMNQAFQCLSKYLHIYIYIYI